MTRPIPRPDVPEGVPTPLSEVVLPPTDDWGAYVPTKREPLGWYALAIRQTHEQLVQLEANERLRFVVMKTLMLHAASEEVMLAVRGMTFDPAVAAVIAELQHVEIEQ